MNIPLIIISFIEGLTEFLPISSTAHLIIVSKILSVDTTDSYIKFYLLFIQFGALLAGTLIFAKRILSNRKLITNIIISFVPSAILGFVFYKLFKVLLEGNMILMSTMLFLGGVIFIYLEKYFMRRDGQSPSDYGKEEITKADALVIGLAQVVAIIPGVSRSGATIVAGILRGIKKAVIFEYTFILALPTLLAAVTYDAYKSREILNSLTSYGDLILGFVISLFVAGITLYILKKYLGRISLSAFGWYRIILAVFIIIIFI